MRETGTRSLRPTRLVDRDNSWAVLVGTSEQTSPSLQPIPQAVASTEDLARALTGADGLFAKERVFTLPNPASVDEITGKLDYIAAQRPDVVLFYYVGHGMHVSLTGEEGGPNGLFLALTGTVDTGTEPVRTGLPVSTVFGRLRLLTSRHAAVVAVLDCCFASRALDDPAVGDTHVLCATGKTTRAFYGLSDTHTAFTGVLLNLLENGIPDGPEYLDLSTLFHHLAVVLSTTPNPLAAEPTMEKPGDCLPRPRQRTTDHCGNIALVRNPAYGTALTPAGLATRTEFAHRVAASGRDPRQTAGDQRMLLAHASDLFAEIAADNAALQAPAGTCSTYQMRSR